MGFWTLFQVASVPNLQVLLISLVGALMASKRCNLLTEDARKSLNRIVFMVFTPSLMFASLAKTVTLEDIISWWFMPVNIALTFIVGGILGWIVVKLVKPLPHLEGVIIAACSSGNLGNLMLIIVPAICKEDGSPFGDKGICSTVGISYASFSMALGGFFIWTYTFQLIRNSCTRYKALEAEENTSKVPNSDFDVDTKAPLLEGETTGGDKAEKSAEDVESQEEPIREARRETSLFSKIGGLLHQILEELMAPPTVAAVLGFIFGAVSWLRNLIIGDGAPLRVFQESIKLLGDGTIPCITLILGGNLTKGFQSSKIGSLAIIGVLLVRYVISPAIGIWVVKAAASLGFLPSDPLYRYVLMVQFTVPPAMNIGNVTTNHNHSFPQFQSNIREKGDLKLLDTPKNENFAGTMTQLFGVGNEECSVLFFWTYLVAALALTLWSTVFMWILS